jgi:hypothetical protein
MEAKKMDFTKILVSVLTMAVAVAGGIMIADKVKNMKS